MRKIREVLRLSAIGINQHKIAQGCKRVQSTVHKYLKLAKAANLSWPLADDWSEDQLQQVLRDRPIPLKRRVHAPPDFPVIHQELSTNKNLLGRARPTTLFVNKHRGPERHHASP